MKVSAILKAKASNDVATIESSEPIASAIATLAELRIGALVVSDGDGRISGILSERDIVHRLAQDGAGVLSQVASDMMTRTVETCLVDETTHEVLSRMTSGRFRHMPVVDSESRMIGILSIGDVVKARLEEIEAENAAMTEMLSH